MAYAEPPNNFTQRGRNEAAAKLSMNKEVVRAGVGASTVPLQSGDCGSILLHMCDMLCAEQLIEGSR